MTDDEHFITADMKEYQAVIQFMENGKNYFTVTGDVFAVSSYAALDLVNKVIFLLSIGDSKITDEWIDKIIFRLQELKDKNSFTE